MPPFTSIDLHLPLFSGISVNDDVMSNANSLMVVNNSLNRLPKMPGPEHVTVVDGPQVLNMMAMQQR